MLRERFNITFRGTPKPTPEIQNHPFPQIKSVLERANINWILRWNPEQKGRFYILGYELAQQLPSDDQFIQHFDLNEIARMANLLAIATPSVKPEKPEDLPHLDKTRQFIQTVITKDLFAEEHQFTGSLANNNTHRFLTMFSELPKWIVDDAYNNLNIPQPVRKVRNLPPGNLIEKGLQERALLR